MKSQRHKQSFVETKADILTCVSWRYPYVAACGVSYSSAMRSSVRRIHTGEPSPACVSDSETWGSVTVLRGIRSLPKDNAKCHLYEPVGGHAVEHDGRSRSHTRHIDALWLKNALSRDFEVRCATWKLHHMCRRQTGVWQNASADGLPADHENGTRHHTQSRRKV